VTKGRHLLLSVKGTIENTTGEVYLHFADEDRRPRLICQGCPELVTAPYSDGPLFVE
jgi:hypothetical protein